MAKKSSGTRDLVKTKGAARSAKSDQGDQKRTSKAVSKGKADPGALKGFEAVPPKPGRRKTTLAKSGYSNLIPKKIKG